MSLAITCHKKINEYPPQTAYNETIQHIFIMNKEIISTFFYVLASLPHCLRYHFYYDYCCGIFISLLFCLGVYKKNTKNIATNAKNMKISTEQQFIVLFFFSCNFWTMQFKKKKHCSVIT